MTYTPQPGTIAYKAINFLRLMPRSKSYSSAELAENIGCSGSDIAASLKTPRRHGIIKAEKVDGLIFWSMGDGIPPAEVVDDADAEDTQPLHPAPGIPNVASSVFALGDRAKPADEKPEQRAGPAVVVRSVVSRPALFGMFSDGTMTISKNNDVVELNAAEVKEMRAFMGAGAT